MQVGKVVFIVVRVFPTNSVLTPRRICKGGGRVQVRKVGFIDVLSFPDYVSTHS